MRFVPAFETIAFFTIIVKLPVKVPESGERNAFGNRTAAPALDTSGETNYTTIIMRREKAREDTQ